MKFFLLLLFLVGALPAHSHPLAVGSPAPDVEAKLLDSPRQIRLSANKGKVTVINFWATWCAPCLAEMPALQAYYDRHKAQGLEILAISMDDPRQLEAVRNVAQKYTFPIALKSQADFKGLGRIWRMPSTFVIDKEGILRRNGSKGEAEVTLESLESLVTPLLSQP